MRGIFFLALTVLYVLTACNGSSFNGSDSSADTSLSADGDSLAQGSLAVVDRTTLSSGLDLVIALDTSGSMDEEILGVENNLGQLILTLQQSNLDVRIHLIADKGDESAIKFPSVISPNQAARIAQQVDSHDALSHISKLLTGLYADFYQDLQGVAMPQPLPLRSGAKLEVLVISDDDGINDEGDGTFSNLAKDFDKDNTWQATVSGIIGLPNSNEAAGVCGVAAIGQEYITLAGKTGGTLLDICAKDWSALLAGFTKDLVKRSASLRLSKKPLAQESISVSLNGNVLPASSWTYDANQNRVVLNAGTDFSAGMVLSANYNGN